MKKKNIQISDKELMIYLEEFYNCFNDGYEFEEFIKFYLEKIGFDEVRVTKRSHDHGIDLTAIRPGIGNLSDADRVYYYIQVKRHMPNTTMAIRYLRELKGVLPFGYKGMFITTAGKFSKNCIKEASDDLSRMIGLVDGKLLMQSCIDNEIGFVYRPVFSKGNLQKIVSDDSILGNGVEVSEESNNDIIIVNKKVTKNDIRARILAIPSDIYKELDTNILKFDVIINDEAIKLSIIRDRKCFAGITTIYRKLNLLLADGTFNEGMAIWEYNNGKIIVSISRLI